MRHQTGLNVLSYMPEDMSMVSCQKGPTRHAYAWQIGPFWQDTLDVPDGSLGLDVVARG